MSCANAHRSHILLGALAELGMKHVVMSPGSRSTPLVLAADERPQLELHTVVDERAAAFIALGIAKASGNAAAFVCTSGSAGAHALPAVIEAAESRVPLILLTADRPVELQQCGAPQTTQQHDLFVPHTRWRISLDAPHDGEAEQAHAGDWLRSLALQLWTHAHRPPCGPVHVNLPFREPLWQADTRAIEDTDQIVLTSGRPRLSANAVGALAQRLIRYQRGLIVCGPVERAAWQLPLSAVQSWREDIAALSETLGWPVLADPCSQLRYGSPLRNLVDCADLLLRDQKLSDQLTPEHVLRFGRPLTSKVISRWLQTCGKHRTTIVDEAGDLLDPEHCTTELVVSDPPMLCSDLVERLRDQASTVDGSWLHRWQEANELSYAHAQRATATGLWEGAVVRELLPALPSDSALHVASSMPIRDLDAFGTRKRKALQVYCNRGVNGIDGTVSTAVGETLAGLSEKNVLLVGDLALQHDMAGVVAAVRAGVDLTVYVLANGGGTIFDFLPIAEHPTAFEERFFTARQVDIKSLCAAVGAKHRQVKSRHQLAPMLEATLAEAGVIVVEITIDRQDNKKRHQQLWHALTGDNDTARSTEMGVKG